MSSFRHRHPLCIHLIFEPTAHVNSPQKVNLRLPPVQMWGQKGSSSVFQWRRGDEGRSKHHTWGHSTSRQWPTRRFPPAARLSNSLLRHGGQCHTQSVSHYRQQNLLISLQEDRGTRGAVQSLETTIQLWSFEAHKPFDVTLGSKKSPDFLAGLTTLLASQEAQKEESMGEINHQIWFYMK